MEHLIDPAQYIDNDKLPMLIELVEEFSKQDVAHLLNDVGEDHVGVSINWKSVAYDYNDKKYSNDALADLLQPILDYAAQIPGINRVTINFLEQYSFMPLHVDNDGLEEYDCSSLQYNIIIPVTDFGQSIIGDRVIKNKKGYPLIFNGQVPHGAMNDTLDTRITIFLLVNKSRFNNDSSK